MLAYANQLTASTLTLLRSRVMLTEEGTHVHRPFLVRRPDLPPACKPGPLLCGHHSATEEGQGGGRQALHCTPFTYDVNLRVAKLARISGER